MGLHVIYCARWLGTGFQHPGRLIGKKRTLIKLPIYMLEWQKEEANLCFLLICARGWAQQKMIEWGQTMGSLARVCVCSNLTSNNNVIFLPRHHTSHIKLKLVKHQSFRQSSERIFCTFIICINAALNYRFFWSLCCLIWLSVSSYCVILQK